MVLIKSYLQYYRGYVFCLFINLLLGFHLNYADIVLDKSDNKSLKDCLDNIQHYAVIAVTRAMKGTSRERICNELGLESIADRRWYRKMTFFYKIVKNLAPKYLQSYLLPRVLDQYPTSSAKKNYWQHYLQEYYHLATRFFLIALTNRIS